MNGLTEKTNENTDSVPLVLRKDFLSHCLREIRNTALNIKCGGWIGVCGEIKMGGGFWIELR